MSLLPLLKGDIPTTSHRSKELGWKFASQTAWQKDYGSDGVWKIVAKPLKGQCSEFLSPYGQMRDPSGPFLFNLTADPTESHDLCSQDTKRCEAMKAGMQTFIDSIGHSRYYEAQCSDSQPPGPQPPSPPPPS